MTLRGIAWDHRRCWGPLDASIPVYQAATGVDVVWDRRSLLSFGLGDLAGLCAQYDLVIYDHPFAGEARVRGLLADLVPWLTDEERAMFAADTVGPSWESYAEGGGIWALPVDTAAQTSARRPDLMTAAGEEMPATLDAVLALAARLRKRGQWVAWPAIPTDQMCTWFSIAASMGLTPGRGAGAFVTFEAAAEIDDWLKRLMAAAHPASVGWNPIRCLDHMAAQDDVVYAPYLFNYVNYQTPPGRVRFGAAPRVAAGHPARTLLGGAGIGVSATAKNPQAAFDYAMFLARPAFQSTDYVRDGGQPGSRTAWTDAACNALTGGFFADCLPVLDASYLRPTYPGFLPLFHDATERLAAVLQQGAPLRPFVDWLNGTHEQAAKVAA